MFSRRVPTKWNQTPKTVRNLASLKVKKEIRFHPGHAIGGKLFGKLFRKPVWGLG